jgi:EmrB/QacA subfamily drug resistance transporter
MFVRHTRPHPTTPAQPISIGAPDPRRWWALAAVCLGLLIALLDNTVVNVALPDIQRSLDATVSDLQWVVSAYSLVFSTLLITGGKLGDLFGRRRVFLYGLAIFTVGSVLCGLSPNIRVLHACRALQGVGGAAIFPLTLAILDNTFSGKERTTAISIWGMVSGVGIALGPVIGGLLVDSISWRAVFFVNVPVAALAAGLTLFAVRESRQAGRRGGIDWIGTVLSAAGLFCIVLALIETQREGWGWGSRNNMLALAGGVALLVLFGVIEIRRQRSGRDPMVDLTLFRIPSFSAANLVSFLVGVALFGVFFFASLYLQNILGLDALQAGLRMLPLAAALTVGSLISGRLVGRVGGRWPIVGGLLLAACGLLLWSALLQGEGEYRQFGWAFPVVGLGMGLVFPAVSTVLLGAVSPDQAGVASGVDDMSSEVGGTFGIAMLAAIFAPAFRHNLTDELTHIGLAPQLAGALERATSGAVATGDPLHHLAQAAFAGAYQTVLHVSAALLTTGAVAAFFMLRQPKAQAHRRRPARRREA